MILHNGLPASELRYRSLLEAVADIVWTVCASGKVQGDQPSWGRFTGQGLAEMQGWGWLQAIHPEDREHTLQVARAAQAARTPSQVEHRVRRHDGEYRTLLARGIPILAEDGQVREWIGVHFDVTGQKRLEEALRSSEELFRSAFSHAAIGMALVAEDGRYLEVNAALCSLLGYAENELLARTSPALTHPDDLAADQAQRRLVRDGALTHYDLEKRYLHKAGHAIDVLMSVSGVRDARGGFRYYVVQVQDITGRKKADATAADARANLLEAIEALDAGLVMYSPDERLVVCNSRYRELYTPCAHKMVPGAPYIDILQAFCQAGAHRASGLSEEEWVARRLADHRTCGPPTEQRLDGRWIRISDRRTPGGSVVSLRTDVTALKAAQEAAEAANRAKSEFLANMSHEIRTPMNGILGMTELGLRANPDATQREYLLSIKTSAEALLRIVNDILDFSKIEAGKLDLESLPFPLRETLAKTMGLLSPRAHEKGLHLTWRVDPEVPDGVIGDPLRLRQVLLNLVGNAIKFTAQGEVTVRIAADEAIDAVVLRCTVRDTGIGIPKDKQATIFQPFAQADNSTTRRYGGTGLGLTISSRLVAMMGGRLEVDSTVGEGSTFHFSVRLGKADGEVVATPSTDHGRRPPAGAALHILLAEDNTINQMVARALLTREGHQVTVVPNGSEAVAALRRQRFDLVLMDLQMPEMDGFEATATLRAEERASGRRTPVIALTAHAMRGDRERCLEAGMDGYVTKPIRPKDLWRAMAAVVRPSGRSPGGVAPRPAGERVSGFVRPGEDYAPASPAAILDRTWVLSQLNNNRVLLRKICDLFRADHPRQLAALRAAATEGKLGDLARLAHALRGTIAHFNAQTAVATAQVLESASRGARLEEARAALAILERELQWLDQELTRWQAEDFA